MRFEQYEGPILAFVCIGAGLGEANHEFGWSLFWFACGFALIAQHISRIRQDEVDQTSLHTNTSS